jgi:phosphatidylserine decarboxylase
MFTKYGYSTLGVIAIIVFLLISISFFINNNWIKIPLIIFSLLLLIFSLNFFRDPDRIPPDKKNIVVSPADGKVLFVKDVVESRFIKGAAKQISIFMSPLNVHVNRIPIDGVVEFVKYYEGEFVAAFEDKASEVNERAEFVINSKIGKVFFTQVAGFVARRLVFEIKTGDTVKIGNRFGMIKFGSRVDIVVPASFKPRVSKNEIVKAGETILFEYLENNESL